MVIVDFEWAEKYLGHLSRKDRVIAEARLLLGVDSFYYYECRLAPIVPDDTGKDAKTL